MRRRCELRNSVGRLHAIGRLIVIAGSRTRTLGGLLLFAAFSTLVAGCGDGTTGPVDDGDGGQGFSHTRAPGSSARDFLSDETYESLTLEIDYVEDLRPSQEAVDSLRVFLERRLNKPGGISIVLDESIPSPGQSPYSADEVRDLEQDHRDTFTEGTSLAGYYLFLDGQFEDQNVLGIAYFNTSMAIFEQVIRDNSGGTTQPPTPVIEAASIRHEIGHILGLVNNGTPMQGEQAGPEDHHDEAHGAHCTEEGTLMYFQVETTDFIQNLQGGEVPPLDPLGIEDLQANGGK